MIVVAVVIGVALALCVAGWVPVLRDALRPEHVLPGPAVQEATDALAAAAVALDPRPAVEHAQGSVTA